jgi:hypothetical protein
MAEPRLALNETNPKHEAKLTIMHFYSRRKRKLRALQARKGEKRAGATRGADVGDDPCEGVSWAARCQLF